MSTFIIDRAKQRVYVDDMVLFYEKDKNTGRYRLDANFNIGIVKQIISDKEAVIYSDSINDKINEISNEVIIYRHSQSRDDSSNNKTTHERVISSRWFIKIN